MDKATADPDDDNCTMEENDDTNEHCVSTDGVLKDLVEGLLQPVRTTLLQCN